MRWRRARRALHALRLPIRHHLHPQALKLRLGLPEGGLRRRVLLALPTAREDGGAQVVGNLRELLRLLVETAARERRAPLRLHACFRLVRDRLFGLELVLLQLFCEGLDL